MLDVFIWYITIQLLGFIFLPYTLALFKRLPDRGYSFSKALSVLIVSFLIWITAYLHILPNTRWAIILIVVLLAAGSLFLFWRRRQEIMDFVRDNRKVIIGTELVFLVAFISWCVVRAYNPAILYSEKFGDFGYVNAIMRSEYFHPHDHWLSGFTLKYYYFGHLMMATLTKLTGIVSSVSYNLSLALVFALTCTGAFGIVYNLVKLLKGSTKAALGFGAVAAMFLVVLGNLEGFLEVLYSNGVGSKGFWEWVAINELDYPPYESQHWYPDRGWWWWHAARVIISKNPAGNYLDYTINEFPMFSFTLGDLHGHLMTLPFALLNLAVCLEFLISPLKLGWSWLKRHWPKVIVFAIGLGALMFLNSWDFATYALLFVAAMLIGEYLRRGGVSFRMFFDAGLVCFVLIVLSVLLYLPAFSILFSTSEHLAETTGGGILAPYGGVDTRPFHFFIFWGLFLFITVSYILAQAWNTLRKGNIGWWAIAVAFLIALLPLIIWAPSVNYSFLQKVTDDSTIVIMWHKLWHLLPAIIIIAIMLLTFFKKAPGAMKAEGEGQRAHIFMLLILFTAFMFLMGCELFNINDRGTWAYERNTTIYKLYYQVWVFMAVGSAVGLYWLARRWRLTGGGQAAAAIAGAGGFIAGPLRKAGQRWGGAWLPRVTAAVGSATRFIADLCRKLFKRGAETGPKQKPSAGVKGSDAPSAEPSPQGSDFIDSLFNGIHRWWMSLKIGQTIAGWLRKAVSWLRPVTSATDAPLRDAYRKWVSPRLRPVTSLSIIRKTAISFWWLVCIALIAAASIYPVITTFYTTRDFGREPTLDGMAHLLYNHPDEYEAIRWLNSEVKGAPVIVESAAGSHYYGSYFRLSAYTGLPTIVGRWGQVPWTVDMTQQEIEYREGAAKTIYKSEDVAEVQQVIADFDVTYVYVGYREINSYSGDKTTDEFAAFLQEKFSSFMDIAFQNEKVIIYKVRE